MDVVRAAFAAAVLLFAANASLAQAPPPVEAYGRLPAISDAAISPDGRHVVIAQSEGAATAFRIIDLDTRQSVYSASFPARNTLRGVGWADDDTATFTLSTTARTGSVAGTRVYAPGQTILEYSRTGVFSLSTRRTAFLLEDLEDASINVGLNGVQAPIEGDPGYGRMQAWTRQGDGARLQIYRVNLRSGRATVAESGHGDRAIDYLLDPRGEIIARADMDPRSDRWQLFVYDAGRPRLLREGENEWGAPPNLIGRMADGRLVVSLTDDGVDDRLVTIDPATNAESPVAGVQAPYLTCYRTDRFTGLLVGYCTERDLPRSHYFDPELAAAQQVLDEMFSDGFARIESWSRDRRRIVVYGETSGDGGAYYMFEPAANNILQLGLRYPNLPRDSFGVRQYVTYPARDGVRIPAYLTLPSADARNLPLIVLVHGGPHERDDFEFDYQASFLASRGYAVLQPQFRGSNGFGYEWFDAGRGHWGDGVMQHDVTDGVDAMVRSGRADAARVCIVGASYGGYAALAGATLTPEKYACAVSIAGIADLLLYLDNAGLGGRPNWVAEGWRLDPRGDREHIRAISPANLAANVRAPVLLMHGPQDTIVPFEQSRIMNDHLRAAGKNVRFVELAGEDHWASTSAGRTQMLRELEAFLAQNLRAN